MHENGYVTTSHTFRTSDLPLAATLALFWPVEDLDRSDDRRVCFLFAHSPELDEAVQSYHRRAMQVEPLAFFHAIKGLKSRLYGDE